MTSFLEIIANDEFEGRVAARKAIVLSKARADQMFGRFIAKQGESALEYLEEDLRGVVQAACDEVGHEDADGTYSTLMRDYVRSVTASMKCKACGHNNADPKHQCENCGSPLVEEPKTSSVHESRKPKMCPWHKDVVDISLADGNARAGFDAMAQHWHGPHHCESKDYEGSRCNFKAPMTTQAYWDQKAEKAEERKQQRQEQMERETVEPTNVEEAPESPVELETNPTEEFDAEVIQFPEGGQDGVSEAQEPVSEEIPMSMAAKTADSGCGRCGEPDVKVGEKCPNCGYTGGTEEDPVWGTQSKTADSDGQGGPVPTMNKKKWEPLAEIDVDDDDGPHPTKRVDIVEPIKPENGSRFDPSKLEEIGEQVTERQDVAEDTGPNVEGGGTWTKGPATAVSSTQDDVHKNPITVLMQGEYEGFEPESVVQAAIAAHRGS